MADVSEDAVTLLLDRTARIETKQDAIIDRLDRRDRDVNRILERHDDRLGKVERLQYRVAAAAAALGLAAGSVGAWLKSLLPASS